jgi:hypothetical protein
VYVQGKDAIYAVSASQRLPSIYGRATIASATGVAIMHPSRYTGNRDHMFCAVRSRDSLPHQTALEDNVVECRNTVNMIADVSAHQVQPNGREECFYALPHVTRSRLVAGIGGRRRVTDEFVRLPPWSEYSGRVWYECTNGVNVTLQVEGYSETLLPGYVFGGRWSNAVVKTCYLATVVGEHQPSQGDEGTPIFHLTSGGVIGLHSFLRGRSFVDVAPEGTRVYYTLTPAHFALAQLQAIDRSDDLFSSEEQFLVPLV